jgi:GH24 family phage-related lysozyme (muramidase)
VGFVRRYSRGVDFIDFSCSAVTTFKGVAVTDLAEQLVGEEEGRSRTAYPDTSSQKLLTIGIGCVVDPRMPGAGLCDEAISAQFYHDSFSARAIASAWPHFANMSPVQQAVYISMAFQLGDKPRGWPHFWAALINGDMNAAQAAGLDSDWARTQTPKRAAREMKMLSTNLWVPHT